MQTHGFSNENWMGILAMHDPTIKLRNIIIPGTHNSASCTISESKLLSSTARCQCLSITEQLLSGVRFFDLRCGKKGEKSTDYGVVHGIMSGGSILQIFNEIISFAKSHPNEFIIVDLINEHDRRLLNHQKADLFPKLAEMVSGHCVKSSHVDCQEFTAQFACIGKVSFDTRCLLILVDPSFYDFKLGGKTMMGSELQEMGFFNRRYMMENKWQREENKIRLLEKNLKFCLEMQNEKGLYIVHQFSFTPDIQFNIKGIFGLLTKPKKLVVSAKFKELVKDKTLHRFMRENVGLAWNIVWFDFLNTVPVLVDFMIGVNFPYPLVIKRASVNVKGDFFDRTQECRGLVSRENTLFLVDIGKDLRLDGWDFDLLRLEIEYRFGEEYLGFVGTTDVTLKKEDMFLLNFPKIVTKFI